MKSNPYVIQLFYLLMGMFNFIPVNTGLSVARIFVGGCPFKKFSWIQQIIIKFTKYSDVHFTKRLTEIQTILYIAVTLCNFSGHEVYIWHIF